MTVAQAVIKAWKKVPGLGIIPAEMIPVLADKLTGTSWSEAVIKPGYEKAFVRAFVKQFRTGKPPDYELLKTWMDRPNLN